MEEWRDKQKRDTGSKYFSSMWAPWDPQRRKQDREKQMETEGDVKEEDQRMGDGLQDAEREKQKMRSTAQLVEPQ